MGRGLFRTAIERGVFFLAVAIFVLVTAVSSAHADAISIGYSVDGGAITSLGSSITGNFSVTGTAIGAFTFNNISGTGSPILSEPQLSTSSLNVQSGAGSHTLNVFITEQGLSFPSGVNSFLSSFNSQTFSGSISSVLEQTFIDTTNGLWGGTSLASANFTGIGSTSSTNNSPSLGPNPYSETVEYTITTYGVGNVNDTIDINLGQATSVPEPSTLVLTGFGLSGLLLLVSKRRLNIA